MKAHDWDAPAKKGPRYETWNWEVIEACAPFAMLRHSHSGYAETENINDAAKCYQELKQAFKQLNEPNISGTRLYISADMKRSLIKSQQTRMQQNNGIYIARLLARLVYLHKQELATV